MSTPNCNPVTHNVSAPDENSYPLGPTDIAFLSLQTRIETEAVMKSHILDIQAKACKVHPYPCVLHLSFVKINLLPGYQDVLKLGRERQNAILLDLGCGFGTDTRKVVADGFPSEGVLASDIHQEFWDLGHELFKSNFKTFPVPFIVGDLLDPSILELVPPHSTAPAYPMPILSSLTSLNPLSGHVSIIHASLLFHMFNEEGQFHLARGLAGLLSPEPGSVILGSQMGSPEKSIKQTTDGFNAYCHSPESWKELWNGQVFDKGKVKVEVSLLHIERKSIFLKAIDGIDIFVMAWSVTRL